MEGKWSESARRKRKLKVVVKEMKTRKVARFDGCAVECLTNGSTSVIKWLVRLLNVCFVTSILPVD